MATHAHTHVHSVDPQLASLVSLLHLQMPALFALVVLRAFVANSSALFVWLLCRRDVRSVAHPAGVVGRSLYKIRSVLLYCVLLSGIAALATQRTARTERCALYTVPRVQGLACACGLLTLSSTRNVFAVAFAFATLCAVRDLSPLALLAACCAVGTTTLAGARRVCLLLVCSAPFARHAFECHSRGPGAVHASVMVVLVTCASCSCDLLGAVVRRLFQKVA